MSRKSNVKCRPVRIFSTLPEATTELSRDIPRVGDTCDVTVCGEIEARAGDLRCERGEAVGVIHIRKNKIHHQAEMLNPQ